MNAPWRSTIVAAVLAVLVAAVTTRSANASSPLRQDAINQPAELASLGSPAVDPQAAIARATMLLEATERDIAFHAFPFAGDEIANALSAMEPDAVPSGFAVGPATLGLEPLRGPPVAKRGVLTLYGLALVYEARAHQDPARREPKIRIGGLELFDAGNASSVRTLSLGIAEGSGDWGWENAVGLGVWYDPETGSFVSADPLGFPDSMNQYAWGVGNYWKADPLGLQTDPYSEVQQHVLRYQANVVPALNVAGAFGTEASNIYINIGSGIGEVTLSLQIINAVAGGQYGEASGLTAMGMAGPLSQYAWLRLLRLHHPKRFLELVEAVRSGKGITRLDFSDIKLPTPRSPSTSEVVAGAQKLMLEADTIPRIPTLRGGAQEFYSWFNSIDPEDFQRFWADPAARAAIQRRLRNPGGMHEWLMVARANVFKRWGVSAEDIHALRSKIDEVEFVNPVGRHGQKGSGQAHDEIIDIIDSSRGIDDFRRRLQNWANYRLKGGVGDLPKGLQPKMEIKN